MLHLMVVVIQLHIMVMMIGCFYPSKNTSIIIQNINLDLGNNNIKKYYGGIMDYDHDNSSNPNPEGSTVEIYN